jgi:LytS/YehU family sensor histidine kinase
MVYLDIPTNQAFDQATLHANKYHVIVDGLFVPFMLFGITAGVKFSKKWFQQQRENERLAKQKLATELQLLKTSIHPRFLFHSLHTVQQYINNSPAQSSALILELSDLLSYVLYEKDENWVELEKELEIIRHYIDLEEKGFGDTLVFETEFPENTKGKFIVPFLLISIVESSFEYFFETGQKKPSLTLISTINENVFHCQLSLSRPENRSMDIILPDERLLSVQKQLQNQYAGLHYLQFTSENKTYSIDLKLPLYAEDLINIKKNRLLNEIPEPV